jgi:uncharacterized membrane protein
VKLVKTVMWILMTFLALAVGLYAFLFFVIPEMGDPTFKSHFATIPLQARMHIIPGGIALVLGAFQFQSSIRKRWINIHRYSGRVYICAVLLGAIGGLLLGWYAPRDPATRLGFSMLAVIWFYSGIMAYLAVRAGDIKLHQQWMVRSYALTLAGVTLRLQLGVLQEIFGLNFNEAYAVVAWFSWIPNLVIAEWVFNQSPIQRSLA